MAGTRDEYLKRIWAILGRLIDVLRDEQVVRDATRMSTRATNIYRSEDLAVLDANRAAAELEGHRRQVHTHGELALEPLLSFLTVRWGHSDFYYGTDAKDISTVLAVEVREALGLDEEL